MDFGLQPGEGGHIGMDPGGNNDANPLDPFDASGWPDFSMDDYNLASMYSQGGPSSKVYGEASHPNASTGYQIGSQWQDMNRKNPFLSVAASLIPGLREVKFVGDILSQGLRGDMTGAGVNMLGKVGGTLGQVVNAGYQASRGNFAPAGGMAGGRFAGPLGAMVGSQVGRAVSGRGGPSAPGTVGMSEGGGGFDLGGVVEGLAGLYGNRGGGNISSADANNQAVSQQIQSLGNMYSPNSPYAQQLRQTLERKDAAAGRRSQYGPREVQLMAALADKQASVSDSMGRLAQTNQANQIALQDRKRIQTGQNLATLGQLARSSGLLNMFSGGGAATPKLIPQYNDSYDDTTWMGTE